MKIFRKNKSNLLSKITKFIFVFVIAFVLVAPAFAEPGTGTGNPGTGTGNPGTGTGNPGTGTGVQINSGIKNPLGNSFADIPSFIEAVLNFFLLIGIPIVTLAIIYSGFLFVTAQGNSEKLKKAKQTLLYTIIGAALLLGSFVIANAIKGTVDEIKSTTK